MKPYHRIPIDFSEAVARDRVSAGLNRIALAVGLLSSNRPSKSKLTLWLVKNADLVIALIRAHRADPDGTRCALDEIGEGEREAAAQNAEEETDENNY